MIRIFSYLPNPRVWKATITGRYLGVEVQVRGAPPRELGQWLWDFDARPLEEDDRRDPALEREGRTGFSGALYKTDTFLKAHPFGNVPAAFDSTGSVGIFESNSIMRAVARLAKDDKGVYGRDPYQASRIDSFLDASLVFARDTQHYLLCLGSDRLTREIHSQGRDAFTNYVDGIERAITARGGFIAGEELTLADICFVAELSLFSRERAWRRTIEAIECEPIDWSGFEYATAHYEYLCQHPAFSTDLAPFLKKLTADIKKHAG